MLMHRKNLPLGLALGTALVVAAATLSRGGPIDPPAGPVAPTMHTLDDIHDAITGLMPSGGCGPGIPGGARGGGTMTIAGLPSFAVLEFSQEAFIPVDSNGNPTGAPRVSEIIITKELDAASPILIQHCLTNTNIAAATLLLDGAPSPYYRIELENARVIKVTPNADALCGGGAAHTEKVSLAYRGITWTHLPSGTSFHYDH